MPAPKSHPNLTRAGQGRPPEPDRVALNTRVLGSTKDALRRMGKIGPSIDRLLAEWRDRGAEIERLKAENEGLRDRLRGLNPTDLP